MNHTEHLLVCLAEECAEIQQAVTKALRFGLSNGNPNRAQTNAEDIRSEILDLIAIAELLEDCEAIPKNTVKVMIETVAEKKRKVNYFMEKSKEFGTLTEEIERGDK